MHWTGFRDRTVPCGLRWMTSENRRCGRISHNLLLTLKLKRLLHHVNYDLGNRQSSFFPRRIKPSLQVSKNMVLVTGRKLYLTPRTNLKVVETVIRLESATKVQRSNVCWKKKMIAFLNISLYRDNVIRIYSFASY